MSLNEIYSIREWAPLNLNERIPVSIQRGLFSIDVAFTCIDAIPDYLAIGTNVGIVFWYNRQGEIQKLRTEIASRITCVKIVDSVEYMVAAGCANGQVSIFRIQKPLPPDLNLTVLKLKPIERYTIRDLHRTPVTCCEWSKNGMKLYSGDRQGIVVLTELDYQSHLSRSIEIISEAYEIVQLSIHQCYLLVSTLYRSCIVQRNINTGKWHITQIGKKDRKQLVECGGVFLKRNAKEPLLIVGRPGLRFWFADTEGNVEKTLMFRDAIIHSSSWDIPLLNPKMFIASAHRILSSNSSNINNSQNFGTFRIYPASDTILLTHNEVSLYLLNVDRLRVEAMARGFRKILDFCVCGNEIFVLEGDRSVIRLAPSPEKPNKCAQIIFNPSFPPPLPNVFSGSGAAGLFESPVEYIPEEKKLNNAEECFELPPVEALNLNVPIELAVESPRAEQNRRFQIFNEISQLDFDQSILHRSGLLMNGRRTRKNHSKERDDTITNQASSGIVEIGQVAKTDDTKSSASEAQKNSEIESNSVEQTMAVPVFMDASFCINHQRDEKLNRELSLELNSKQENVLAKKHISPISPIAAEEYERAQFLAAANIPNEHNYNDIGSPIYNFEYPNFPCQSLIENPHMQNIPYCIEQKNGMCDYSSGQPIDELCQALQSIPPNMETEKSQQQKPLQLQFVTTQPAVENIDSFLPDFRRIRDPLHQTPPPSGGSGTSSEWEFLDN